MNRELLFMLKLDDGEQFFIKGKYNGSTNKISFITLGEDDEVENLEDVFNGFMCMYEEDKEYYDLLIAKIKNDNLLDKIQRNNSTKLLFSYDMN